MKDKVKTALKRASSGLMAVLLAVCLVGTPKADAVVLEGSYLGSVFGTVLTSLGYSWASDNMGNTQFGEAIYSLMTDWASEKSDDVQTYLNNLADLVSTGLVVAGQGKLQLSYNIMNLARDFAEWFQGKFFTGDASISVIKTGSILMADGTYIELSSWDGHSSTLSSTGTILSNLGDYTFADGTIIRIKSDGAYYFFPGGATSYSPLKNLPLTFILYDSCLWSVHLNCGASVSIGTNMLANGFTYSIAKSLSAEKPQEVHYPNVAEDGSQVYEITVDGVTAIDIEGIIQGAVDRILAGTAAIAGEVAQAGAVEDVENPEIEPYKVGLSSVFPFCIPFDVYNMVTMFVAEPEAPSAEWTFTLPWSSQQYSVGWDLSDFDGVAQVCRSMELVLFAVGLAVITYKVIKW